MKVNGRIVTSLVMTLVFTLFVIQALSFRHEAAVMPLLVGLPGLVLSLVQLFIEVRAGAARADDSPVASTREMTIMLWIAGFTLGVIGFGFVLGAPVLLAAYLYFVAAERLPVAALGGLLCLAVMAGLERLLNIPLFEGLAFHYLF